MSAVLVDTTILIDLLRGRTATAERVRKLRTQGDTIYTSAINVEEVTRGLRPDEVPAAEALMTGLRIAPLGRIEGTTAGAWRRDFARRGRTLSQSDCLIAAAALCIGARLATGNPKDFPMKDVTIDPWPSGR